MATVLLEDHAELQIPTIDGLADFRCWALSDAFPQRGRIDFVMGRVEVDMSPEDLFTHGTLKSAVAAVIGERVRERDLGHTFIGETRISSVPGDVSAEPDLVVLSFDAIDQRRVDLIPKASGEEGRYVEVEGAVDLIVEIVSDSSVHKDTKRLPAAYYAAGVREFWLIDARGKELLFQIFNRGEGGYLPAPKEDNGFQLSTVLDASFLLERQRHQRGHWVYRLISS